MKILCLCSICILILSHPRVWTRADPTCIITLLAGEGVLICSLRALPFDIICPSLSSVDCCFASQQLSPSVIVFSICLAFHFLCPS